MSNVVTLKKLAQITMGQSPPGSSCNSVGKGDPLLNGPTEFGFSHPTPVQFTTDGRRFCEDGDVLFCVRGSTTGRMNLADQRYALGRGLASFSHRGGKDLNGFLLHLIDHNLKALLNNTNGSTFPNLTGDLLASFKISVPPEPEQKKIAAVLSALDEKIELNNRINAELETMAKTLYDYWFVQFDFPDANGRPYKSSGGKMVYNSTLKRDIPEGWDGGNLGSVVSVRRGKTITQKTTNNGIVPVVAGGLEPAYFHDEANVKAPVITVSASGANAGFVNLYLEDIWASDCSFISASKEKHICYRYLEIKRNQIQISGMQLGSAQPHVYPKDIENLQTNFPENGIIELFETMVRPKFEMIGSLKKQNQQLTSLRDFLLPMLMNGQVQVGKV